MRRRALLAGVAAVVLLGACSEPSRIARDAKVTVQGTVEDVDGTPLDGRPVRLGSGVSGLEGTAGALTLGLFCATGECSGDAFDAETDGDGQYAFELTGADTQSTFGEAESFLLSTSGAPRLEQVSAPVVSARLRIQVEDLTLPTLRLVDPLLRLGTEGRTVTAVWEGTPPGPYALGFRGSGRTVVWEVEAAAPAAAFDGRVLEDAIGLATVAGGHEEQAAGSDVTVRWRSGGIAYRGGFGAPPSRGATCSASGGGVTTPLEACPVTDGAFGAAAVAGQVCPEPTPATASEGEPPACPSLERVRVELARPVAAELLVVRGCAGGCRAAVLPVGGGAAVDVGPLDGPFAALALDGTRVTAVDVLLSDPTDLAEVSVWGAVDGPALRPVEDPEEVPGATDEDRDEDRAVPAVVATVALVGALVVLSRVRPALAR